MPKALQNRGIEELDLEDLTCASGLKALRIEVDFSDLTPNVIDTAEIEGVVSQNLKCNF